MQSIRVTVKCIRPSGACNSISSCFANASVTFYLTFANAIDHIIWICTFGLQGVYFGNQKPPNSGRCLHSKHSTSFGAPIDGVASRTSTVCCNRKPNCATYRPAMYPPLAEKPRCDLNLRHSPPHRRSIEASSAGAAISWNFSSTPVPSQTID